MSVKKSDALVTCGRAHVWSCAQMCAHGPRCRSGFFFFEPQTAMLWLLAHSNRLSRFLFIFDMPRGSGVMLKKKGKKEVHWCPWRKSGQPNGSFEDYFAWGASLWDCAWGARRSQRKLCNILRDKTRAAKQFLINKPLSGWLKKFREESDIRSSAEVDPVLHSSETSHLKIAHLAVCFKGPRSGGWLRAASECLRHLMANSTFTPTGGNSPVITFSITEAEHRVCPL